MGLVVKTPDQTQPLGRPQGAARLQSTAALLTAPVPLACTRHSCFSLAQFEWDLGMGATRTLAGNTARTWKRAQAGRSSPRARDVPVRRVHLCRGRPRALAGLGGRPRGTLKRTRKPMLRALRPACGPAGAAGWWWPLCWQTRTHKGDRPQRRPTNRRSACSARLASVGPRRPAQRAARRQRSVLRAGTFQALPGCFSGRLSARSRALRHTSSQPNPALFLTEVLNASLARCVPDHAQQHMTRSCRRRPARSPTGVPAGCDLQQMSPGAPE